MNVQGFVGGTVLCAAAGVWICASCTGVENRQPPLVGDGVSDDTAAIQAQVDAAWRRGGGEVVMEPGEHRIGASPQRVTLRLKSGARIVGSTGIGDCLGALGPRWSASA